MKEALEVQEETDNGPREDTPPTRAAGPACQGTPRAFPAPKRAEAGSPAPTRGREADEPALPEVTRMALDDPAQCGAPVTARSDRTDDPDPIIRPLAMAPDGTLYGYDRRRNILYRFGDNLHR